MKAYITIGLPFSGKTEWAEEIAEYSENKTFIIERGAVRAGVMQIYDTQKSSRMIEDITAEFVDRRIKLTAEHENDVILSDTNLRLEFLNRSVAMLLGAGYSDEDIYIVDFRFVPLETLLSNMKESGANWKEEKLIKLYNKCGITWYQTETPLITTCYDYLQSFGRNEHQFHILSNGYPFSITSQPPESPEVFPRLEEFVIDGSQSDLLVL